jgi:hypothetical protein
MGERSGTYWGWLRFMIDSGHFNPKPPTTESADVKIKPSGRKKGKKKE